MDTLGVDRSEGFVLVDDDLTCSSNICSLTCGTLQLVNRMLPHSPSKAEESGKPALSTLAVTLAQVMVMVTLRNCHAPQMGALPIFTGFEPL